MTFPFEEPEDYPVDDEDNTFPLGPEGNV